MKFKFDWQSGFGLLLFSCNYVVYVRRGFLFLLVLGIGCVIFLWQSLSLKYNYFGRDDFQTRCRDGRRSMPKQ